MWPLGRQVRPPAPARCGKATVEASAESLQGRSKEGLGVPVPFLCSEWGPAMSPPGSEQHPGSLTALPAPGHWLEAGGVGGREEPEPSHSSSCVSPQKSLGISELWSIYLNLKAWGNGSNSGCLAATPLPFCLFPGPDWGSTLCHGLEIYEALPPAKAGVIPNVDPCSFIRISASDLDFWKIFTGVWDDGVLYATKVLTQNVCHVQICLSWGLPGCLSVQGSEESSGLQNAPAPDRLRRQGPTDANGPLRRWTARLTLPGHSRKAHLQGPRRSVQRVHATLRGSAESQPRGGRGFNGPRPQSTCHSQDR